jgi:Zn-dependent peptidase ImmA (M78 family)
MTLRRGFKKEANELALEVRRELSLDAADPIDVRALAKWLEIPVVSLKTLAATVPDAVHHFHVVEPKAFSALTVFDEPARLIVYNDRHSPARRASDIAHELAHALLLHAPHAALDENGCRVWAAECEEEADWLGGTLLIPDEAALMIVRQELSLADAATRYGVSRDMVTYRLNVTGARLRVARAARR